MCVLGRYRRRLCEAPPSLISSVVGGLQELQARVWRFGVLFANQAHGLRVGAGGRGCIGTDVRMVPQPPECAMPLAAIFGRETSFESVREDDVRDALPEGDAAFAAVM